LIFDFFASGLHTRTAVARLPLRQLGFLVLNVTTSKMFYAKTFEEMLQNICKTFLQMF